MQIRSGKTDELPQPENDATQQAEQNLMLHFEM
jgi:hypothetical protein